jgi:exodeoxyribonuclease-3
MRLATWNVNSLAVRLPQLLQWLAPHQPDAMVLQETTLTDDKFPATEIAAEGYQAQRFGQKAYNGVALLSKAEAIVTRGELRFASLRVLTSEPCPEVSPCPLK